MVSLSQSTREICLLFHLLSAIETTRGSLTDPGDLTSVVLLLKHYGLITPSNTQSVVAPVNKWLAHHASAPHSDTVKRASFSSHTRINSDKFQPNWFHLSPIKRSPEQFIAADNGHGQLNIETEIIALQHHLHSLQQFGQSLGKLYLQDLLRRDEQEDWYTSDKSKKATMPTARKERRP